MPIFTKRWEDPIDPADGTRILITRSRDTKDRRVVHARITNQGLKLIKGLDQPVQDAHRRQLGHLGEKRLTTLSRLLEEARGALPVPSPSGRGLG